jgi:creatinase
VSDDMIRIYEMNNGEKAFSPFSSAEMDRRQNSLRKLMAARQVDACLFTSYHNICYYSGFLYCYFGRKYGCLVTQENATTIAAGIDGGQPWRRTYGDTVIYTDWRRDNYFHAIQSLLNLPDPSVKRIGIEFDHVSLDFKALLEAALPGIELVDIAADAMSQRTIKSAEEQHV